MPALRSVLNRLVAALALGLGGVGALGAAAGLGGGLSRWLDVSNHALPLWAGAGLAAWLVARLAPRALPRRLAQTLGVLALILTLPFIALELFASRGPHAPADAPRQIRVVQINVWHVDELRPATIDWLLSERPDIITMQEAPQSIRDALQHGGGYHVTCQDGRPQWCQSAVFSLRQPLRAGLVEDDLPGPVTPLARATFAGADGRPFTVISAHLEWPLSPALQASQRERLGALIADSGPRERVILGGDFNSAPWSHARRQDDRTWGLRRRTRAIFTWPTSNLEVRGLRSPLPLLPIDHLYAGAAWRTVDVKRGPKVGSDHYPIVLTLALDDRSASGSTR
jgi:endonuclease/exonuclease/phosphatase (EEP) superfamily protein YafD